MHTSTSTVTALLFTRLFYTPRTTIMFTGVTKLSSQASICTGVIFFVTVSSVTRNRAHLITNSSPYTKWAFQAVPSANVTVKPETGQRARKITEISPVPRYTFVGTLSVIFITPWVDTLWIATWIYLERYKKKQQQTTRLQAFNSWNKLFRLVNWMFTKISVRRMNGKNSGRFYTPAWHSY